MINNKNLHTINWTNSIFFSLKIINIECEANGTILHFLKPVLMQNSIQQKIYPYNANEYYPTHFEIVQFKRERQKPKNDLVGRKASDWILNDIDCKDVNLSDLKSKVLLVQFTGVVCGPCHLSIPFLKQLVEDYKEKDFEFISIETWSNNIEGLKRYEQKNSFNFKFLESTDEVTKSYNVYSVPTFFIIDGNRIIRKVINGYSKENTDNEIKESIDKYL